YYCLSYCWGDYNPTQDKNILVNGKQFLVRANLWDFLDVARRKYPDRLFWIDAICINQSDNDEKGREVKRMGEIFSNATGVVVWLG
ncbi:heterokaryon incompatibility, partial [Amniculicola lignicola CBS 123094]